MFKWPETLIAEVAERRCIVFIGAGFSRFAKSADGSSSPPLWNEFLEHLKAMMTDTASLPLVDELILKGAYLDAAEIIKAHITDPEYNGFIQRELRDPSFVPAKVHEYLRDLDLKVVITTNYDTIYEDCCSEGDDANLYNTLKYHDEGLLDDLRSTRRVIIKAHGCAKAQPRTVLTRSGYFAARQKHPSFFSILDALFTTNTLLFIGYGLGDPDIQLVLENVSLKTPASTHHYVVAEQGRHPALKEAMKRSFNLHFLEHDTGNYNQVEESLLELRNAVAIYRNNHS